MKQFLNLIVCYEKVHRPCELKCPPGNWTAPAGSILENYGGNEMA
jgi:hypothetical protein